MFYLTHNCHPTFLKPFFENHCFHFQSFKNRIFHFSRRKIAINLGFTFGESFNRSFTSDEIFRLWREVIILKAKKLVIIFLAFPLFRFGFTFLEKALIVALRRVKYPDCGANLLS